jgi:acylphosphatase
VQGVGFRANTKRKAVQLGLVGWVRNNSDGSVEAIVEGKEEEVDRLIKWCHRGPTSAHVREIKFGKEPAIGIFNSFRITI